MRCPICGNEKPDKNKFCSFTCRNKWINSRKNYPLQGLAIAKTKALLFPKKDFDVICSTCGVSFCVRERVEKFPLKEKYFCSRSCANTRNHTVAVKKKISSALQKRYQNLSIEEKIKRVTGSTCGKRIFRSKGEISLLKLLKRSIPHGDFTYGGAISYNGNIISRDIISTKLKVGIEYDGIWHFKDIKNQLKQKQFKDRLYEEWITKSDYRLIRVTATNFSKNLDLYEELVDAILHSKKKILKLYHFDKADFKI